jgi:hypothetical protein
MKIFQIPIDRIPHFTTLQIYVPNDPKLMDDGGEVPKLNGVVSGLIPSREIVSLVDKKT